MATIAVLLGFWLAVMVWCIWEHNHATDPFWDQSWWVGVFATWVAAMGIIAEVAA